MSEPSKALDLTNEERQVLSSLVDYDVRIAADIVGVSQKEVAEMVRSACERNDMEEARLLFIYRMERAGHDWPPPAIEPSRSLQWNYGGLNGRVSKEEAVVAQEYPELTEDVLHELFDEYQAGENLAEIAARYDIEGFDLFTKFRELGLVQRRNGVFKHDKQKKNSRVVLTDAQVREAHTEYWNSSESQAKVAKRWGVTGNTLSLRFKQLSLPTRASSNQNKKEHGAPRKFSDDDIRDFYQEYTNGALMKELATQHNISRATLSRRFAELGLTTRTKGNAGRRKTKKSNETKPVKDKKRPHVILTDEQIREAHAEYWNSNESQAKVGERWGVSNSTLSTRFKRLGLPVRTRSDYKKLSKKTLQREEVKIDESDDIRRIHNDYISSGDPLERVAERHGVSKPTLYRRFKAASLLTRGQGQHEHIQQTVLEPPLTPNGNDGECSENYDLLAMLIKHLPRDGKWTSVERDNYIKAYTAVLDLLTEVIDESK